VRLRLSNSALLFSLSQHISANIASVVVNSYENVFDTS
jgi:hypothetical protein